jgi:hypothetical protein
MNFTKFLLIQVIRHGKGDLGLQPELRDAISAGYVHMPSGLFTAVEEKPVSALSVDGR